MNFELDIKHCLRARTQVFLNNQAHYGKSLNRDQAAINTTKTILLQANKYILFIDMVNVT